MSAAPFNWQGLVARLLFCLFIVFALYNPSGYSYLHWLAQGFDWFWAKLAVGSLLVLVLRMLWRTTSGALKPRGMVLVGLFCLGSGVTLARLADASILAPGAVLIWALLTLAALFTAGLCISHIDHRLGGITHTEELK